MKIYPGFLEGETALTLELGLRMTHFTPWADDKGSDSVFNPVASM